MFEKCNYFVYFDEKYTLVIIMEDGMIIKKLKSGIMEAFTYIFGCEETGEAVVIDPCRKIDEVVVLVEKERLQIKYIFNSHYHFDHTNF